MSFSGCKTSEFDLLTVLKIFQGNHMRLRNLAITYPLNRVYSPNCDSTVPFDFWVRPCIVVTSRGKMLEIAWYSGIDVLVILWTCLLNIMKICKRGREMRFVLSPFSIREHFLVSDKDCSPVYVEISSTHLRTRLFWGYLDWRSQNIERISGRRRSIPPLEPRKPDDCVKRLLRFLSTGFAEMNRALRLLHWDGRSWILPDCSLPIKRRFLSLANRFSIILLGNQSFPRSVKIKWKRFVDLRTTLHSVSLQSLYLSKLLRDLTIANHRS
jgi:hypothetical protein